MVKKQKLELTWIGKDDEVQKKKLAAIQYCKYATSNDGKGWEYMIIPHTKVKLNNDLSYFVSRYIEK